MSVEDRGNKLSRFATRDLRHRLKDIVKKDFDVIAAELNSDDICVDFGANIGSVSTELAQSGATVHAFEPDPETFTILKENLSQFENVILYQAAIGKDSRMVTLRKEKQNARGTKDVSLGSSVVFDSRRMETTGESVNQIGIVDFIESLGQHIRLVKVDIEGAEFELLDALLRKPRLFERIDHMFVETHERQEPTFAKRLIEVRKRLEAVPHCQVNLYWY